MDDPGRRRLPARDANAARGRPHRAEALADAAEEPEIENGRITEIAGPRAERLADVAAALFASRGDSIRSARTAWADDPDAAAYADGAVLPNPGAKLAGPTFEEWLAALATA